jgi:hypothetical protein
MRLCADNAACNLYRSQLVHSIRTRIEIMAYLRYNSNMETMGGRRYKPYEGNPIVRRVISHPPKAGGYHYSTKMKKSSWVGGSNTFLSTLYTPPYSA